MKTSNFKATLSYRQFVIRNCQKRALLISTRDVTSHACLLPEILKGFGILVASLLSCISTIRTPARSCYINITICVSMGTTNSQTVLGQSQGVTMATNQQSPLCAGHLHCKSIQFCYVVYDFGPGGKTGKNHYSPK